MGRHDQMIDSIEKKRERRKKFNSYHRSTTDMSIPWQYMPRWSFVLFLSLHSSKLFKQWNYGTFRVNYGISRKIDWRWHCKQEEEEKKKKNFFVPISFFLFFLLLETYYQIWDVYLHSFFVPRPVLTLLKHHTKCSPGKIIFSHYCA